MSTLIIAEAGVNHNGDVSLALDMIDVAADAGADVIKFQTFEARKLASKTAKKANYQVASDSSGETQLDMLSRLELDLAEYEKLLSRSQQRGIQLSSTPFDAKSLTFLAGLNLPFLKIPSGEVTNSPLLVKFGQTQQDLILSTGMARIGEVEQALASLAWGRCHSAPPTSSDELWRFWSSLETREAALERITLLHCTSQYPAPLESVNLFAMDTLSQAFGLPVGYSDHTEGEIVALSAVARGATVIEKHFTLDRSLPGPDHKASMEPDELRRLISNIRQVESSLGGKFKVPHVVEFETRDVARQRIVAARNIARGEIFTEENLTTIRSRDGLFPNEMWDLLGTEAGKNYERGAGI